MKTNYKILLGFILSIFLTTELSAQLPLTSGSSYYVDSPQSEMRLAFHSQNSVWDTLRQFTYAYSRPQYPAVTLVNEYRNEVFEPSTRSTRTFDVVGRQLTLILERSQNGNWLDHAKSEKSYDHNGDVTFYLEEGYNGTGWDTMSFRRTNYTYNNDQLPVMHIMQIWDGIRFKDYDSVVTLYNSAGETDSIFRYNIGAPSSTLIGITAYSSWENFQQRLPDSINQYSSNGSWVASEAFHYVSGQLSGYESESMVTSWGPRRRIVTYDSLGYMLLDSNLSDNGQGWEMSNCYRYDYTRDFDGKLSEVLISRLGLGFGTYSPSEKYIFESFWTSTTPSLEESHQLEIGPNPATSYLNIRSSMPQNGPNTIQLFDIQGRLRMETIDPKPSAETQIQLPESLPAGSYLLVLQNRNARSTAKVQIIR